MRRIFALLFSLIFIAICALVPIVQAVVDRQKGERIRLLDLVDDTFLHPRRRAQLVLHLTQTLGDTLAVLAQGSRAAAGGEPALQLSAEEALALAEEIQRTVVSVNRYVNDSLTASAHIADTLVSQVQGMFDALEQGVGETALPFITAASASNSRLSKHSAGVTAVSGYGSAVFTQFFRYTVFNQYYLRAYERELENQSVFAASIRPVMQWLRYRFLGDVGDKAIAGRAGWLFFKPGIDYLYRPAIDDPRSVVVDANDKPLTDDPLAVIVDFKKQLAQRGSELLVVIVPGKGSIYPEKLDAAFPEKLRSTVSHSPEFIAALRSAGVAAVDLFTPFTKERKNDEEAGECLYMATDTHWRSRALLKTAQVVATWMKNRSWYAEEHAVVSYAIDTVLVNRLGDIGEMTGLTKGIGGHCKTTFPSEPVICYRVMQEPASAERNDRIAYKDDFRRSRVLILGDSFSRIYQTDEPRAAGWIAHLARELAEPLCSIVSDGGASTLVRETLARRVGVLKRKRLVIWEFVERDLRFGAAGWKPITLP